MENPESQEAPEISNIKGQQLGYAMDVHACSQPGVMDLHALDVVLDQKGAPALVDLPAVRQKLEILFDHTGQAIRLGNTQAEAVLVERPGRGIPELAQRL